MPFADNNRSAQREGNGIRPDGPSGRPKNELRVQSSPDRPIADDGFGLPLPNGLTFFVPTKKMRRGAQFDIKEIFSRGRYTRPSWRIDEDDVLVDIGANKGAFALWATPLVPRGRVVAVEPAPIVEVLRTNVERNDLRNVTVINAAVGRPDTTVDLVVYADGLDGLSHSTAARVPKLTSLLLARATREVVTVPSLSLAQVLAHADVEAVKLLKVDIEGGEYDMFDAMTDGDWKRIQYVVLEFHRFSEGHTETSLVATLESNGFKVEVERSLAQRAQRVGFLWAWK